MLDGTAVEEVPMTLLEIGLDEESTVLDKVLVMLKLELDETKEVLVDGLPKSLGRTVKGGGTELEVLDIVVEVMLMIVTVLTAAVELLGPALVEREVELITDVFELGPRELDVVELSEDRLEVEDASVGANELALTRLETLLLLLEEL